MPRSSLIAPAILSIALLVGGCQQWHKDKDAAKEERTSMTALPSPVRDAFNRDFPNANVSYIARETEKDGAIHWLARESWGVSTFWFRRGHRRKLTLCPGRASRQER